MENSQVSFLLSTKGIINQSGVQESSGSAFEKVSVLSEEDTQWLQALNSFIEKNLQKEILTIPFLAGHFAMSESTLLRKIKRLTGRTPVSYIQMIRLEKARELLENQDHHSIEQVMQAVGYSSASSFARNFKQHFGQLPSELIKH